MSFLARYIHRKLSDPRPGVFKKMFLWRKLHLTQFFRIYFSQFGEDIVLKSFIPKTRNAGFYVDVGCYHPKKYSNTYKLYRRGWRGINIDLDPLKIEAFNMARPGDCNIAAAVSDDSSPVPYYQFGHYSLISTIHEPTAEEYKRLGYELLEERKVYPKTLTELIDATRFRDRQIDLLSIDVEGHEMHVIRSLDWERYRPKLLIVESHLRELNAIQQSELYAFLTGRGYRLINWVGVSLFFDLPGNDLTDWLHTT